MEIVSYKKEEYKAVWDDFVMTESENGTVFHTHNFLSYHGENKFIDKSILIYDGKKLAAVMLAAEIDGEFVSHPGTTGGGLVVSKNYYRVEKLDEIVTLMYEHFDDKICLRITEDIFYSSKNNTLLLYLLGRKRSVNRELSMNIVINNDKEGVDHIIRASTRSAVRKYFKDGFSVKSAQSNEELIEYHEILCGNLKKFDSAPVHSVQDILKLKELLGNKLLYLKGIDENGNTLGGLIMIRATKDVWHTQYIAKNYTYGIHSVVPAIIAMAIDRFKKEGITNFNLGPCTEEGGDLLNTSLAAFKESLGATAVSRYIIS